MKKTILTALLVNFTIVPTSFAFSMSDFLSKNKAEVVTVPSYFPKIKEVLNQNVKNNNFPTSISVDSKTYNVKYTFDKALNNYVNNTLKKYDPDFAAAVVIDADTGDILSMSSHSTDFQYVNQNLCLKAAFPSASVFKIVTSAAAIESAQFNSLSVIRFNGSLHTLYKRNIKDSRYYSNHLTLNDAFAKSANVVFARIGIKNLGENRLTDYAQRFLFNKAVPLEEVNVEKSVYLRPDSDFETAEVASGYTTNTKMSPIHGALIASIIANNGKVVKPKMVKEISDSSGKPIFQTKTEFTTAAISEKTAEEMKVLMHRTITNGTSRKSFKNYARDPVLRDLFIGGKTGHLTGDVVRGKHDWFVGFAEEKKTGKKLAIAVLTVNKKFWKVKSAQLANFVFKEYFKNN